MTSDFLPRGQRRFYGTEIQLGTIDERLYPSDKLARQTYIASGMAHLDHGLQFPIMGDVRVIMDGMGERDGRLSFVALGT